MGMLNTTPADSALSVPFGFELIPPADTRPRTPKWDEDAEDAENRDDAMLGARLCLRDDYEFRHVPASEFLTVFVGWSADIAAYERSHPADPPNFLLRTFVNLMFKAAEYAARSQILSESGASEFPAQMRAFSRESLVRSWFDQIFLEHSTWEFRPKERFLEHLANRLIEALLALYREVDAAVLSLEAAKKPAQTKKTCATL